MTATIALVTYHQVSNYGSVLQAFATQQVLSRLGAQVTTVNYVNNVNRREAALDSLVADSRFAKAPWLARSAFRLASAPDLRRAYSVFEDFRQRRLSMTRLCYSEADVAVALPDGIGAYCVGSDQVWNPRSSSRSQGVDRVFFLSFAPADAYKFSFSSSFGTLQLSESEAVEVRSHLESFGRLSVREPGGLEILASMGLTGMVTLDPTLLEPVETWRSLASVPRVRTPYVLVYQLHSGQELGQYARRAAERLGGEVIRLSFFWRNSLKPERTAYLPTPEEFIGLVMNASLVVTDSFHGCVFSTMLHTPFVAFAADAFSSRITGFLSMIGLDGRREGALEGRPAMEVPIDWAEVEARLDALREGSMHWLSETMRQVPQSP